MSQSFHPDFTASCHICGSSPCVVVNNHPQGDTELCGPCFFLDAAMFDWNEWNQQELESDAPEDA